MTHIAHLTERQQSLTEGSAAIGQPARGGVAVGSSDTTHPSAAGTHGLGGVPRVRLIPAHAASSSCVPTTPQESGRSDWISNLFHHGIRRSCVRRFWKMRFL